MYFPAAILTGRIDLSTATHGFGIQVAWVLVFIIASRFIWMSGLRKHTAVGG
jgi:ABC-2 type transport system permease protein